MKNKLKLGLFIIVMFVLLGLAGNANAAALTWSNDTLVTIGSANYTIGSGSAATSITVGATTLTVTVPSGSSFTLTSADRYNLNNSPGLGSFTCGASTSSLVLSEATTDNVITPDPSHVCSAGSGGNSSGGSGGSSKKTTTPPVVVPPTPSPTPTPVAGEACSYNLGMATLKNGSRGAEVMELQRFLNATMNLGLVVDGALGPKTIAVMMQWQNANGLVVDGLIGPMTKAKINSIAATRCATPAIPGETPATPNAQGYAFGTLTVKEGTKGEACKAWQMFLNDKANAGLMADGNCGPKTMVAAKAWQASVGLTADGFLGAMSRAKALAQ